jgi:ATP-dependent Clp protease ATP-binding subunit ClpC
MQFGNLDNKVSPSFLSVMEKSGDLAEQNSQESVMPRDILICILLEKTTLIEKIYDKFKIEQESIVADLSNIHSPKNKNKRKHVEEELRIDTSSQYIINFSDKIVTKFSHDFIDLEHIILAFLSYTGRNNNIVSAKTILEKYGITDVEFRKEFILIYDSDEVADTFPKEEPVKENKQKAIEHKPQENSKASKEFSDKSNKYDKLKANLIAYGYIEDLNKKVTEKPEIFFGRETEIKRCIQILCRKSKRNVIVLGENGVGKTKLVEGIVKKIVEGDVPEKFKNAEVVSINFGNIVAGTKYRGQFEERMKVIATFVDDAAYLKKNLIIFMDEIHTLVNAGAAEGSLNASAILKPKLASDSIQCIGATTTTDYRKYFLKDEALARRFSIVTLEEPQKEEVVKMLIEVKPEYEKHHNLTISRDVVEEITTLSERYIKNRHFPDKAFDVLDESCSLVAINNGIEVTSDIIKSVISDFTGIPITSLSNDQKTSLLHLEKSISEKVVAQDKAIKIVSDAIKRSRIGLKDENKPIGVFLFLGSSGCGKTLLTKTLSECLFGKNKLIRLDMSEYMEKHSISKIVGAHPGYVGYDDGSAFCEEVRKKPYSVILLDEIEKADHAVLNIFLQIFDEGRMTDSFGRLVDFRNTIIIMTSNLATSKMKKQKTFGFSTKPTVITEQRDIEQFLMGQVKSYFSSEFMNRIDATVVFEPISKEAIEKIFEIEFGKFIHRVGKIGYGVSISESASAFLCEKGFSDEYGARPMVRAIQQYIEIPITEKILETDDSKKIVFIDLVENGEDLKFEFSEK